MYKISRMLSFRYVYSAKLAQSSFSTRLCKLSTSHYRSSENEDQTKGGKNPVDEKSKEPKETDISERLKLLIKSMEVTTASPLVADKAFAKPKQRGFMKQLEMKTNKTKEALQPGQMANAAKEVAKSFGGDVKEIEMQLMSKVASQSAKTKADSRLSSSSSSSSSDSDSSSSDDEASSPKKKASAPEPELKMPVDSKPNKTTPSLSELIIGMKIDRSKSPQVEGRASQVRRALGNKNMEEAWQERDPTNRTRQYKGRNDSGNDRRSGDRRERNFNYAMPNLNRAPIEVKLFGNKRLGIFSEPVKTEVDQLATWRTLKEREVRLATTHPPRNYFEEMILWTEQGKLWRFPIDNEQDQDMETGVSFADHVFLEPLLEPWCPRKGPVRHFMELVCGGLAKNYHLTAAEKRAHIEWFRDYFEAKRDILLETGALEAGEMGTSGRQTLEAGSA